ncbi:MAG: hypothetical protein WA323_06435 [Candidatus Nitrosopolaris sp.]
MNTKQILITALVIALTLTVVAIAVSTPTASMARADSCTSEDVTEIIHTNGIHGSC